MVGKVCQTCDGGKSLPDVVVLSSGMISVTKFVIEVHGNNHVMFWMDGLVDFLS